MKLARFSLSLALCLITGCFGPCAPMAARWEGEAEFAQAEQNRKIKVLEAQALLDSAKYQAEAEVTRASGVAQANKIIGDSLKGNEGYLRWLWIKGLEDSATKAPQVIYVPTEAGLPILESRRLETIGAQQTEKAAK